MAILKGSLQIFFRRSHLLKTTPVNGTYAFYKNLFEKKRKYFFCNLTVITPPIGLIFCPSIISICIMVSIPILFE